MTAEFENVRGWKPFEGDGGGRERAADPKPNPYGFGEHRPVDHPEEIDKTTGVKTTWSWLVPYSLEKRVDTISPDLERRMRKNSEVGDDQPDYNELHIDNGTARPYRNLGFRRYKLQPRLDEKHQPIIPRYIELRLGGHDSSE